MAVNMEVANSKQLAPQEAVDDMKTILKQLIEFNDKWNDGRYLAITLVSRKNEDDYDSISCSNDYYELDAKRELNKFYDQDELRAETKEEA